MTTINYKSAIIQVKVTEIEEENSLDGDITSRTKKTIIDILINNQIKGDVLQYDTATKIYSIDDRGQKKLSKEAGDLIVEAIKNTNYEVIIFDPSKKETSKIDTNLCPKCDSYKIDCECN